MMRLPCTRVSEPGAAWLQAAGAGLRPSDLRGGDQVFAWQNIDDQVTSLAGLHFGGVATQDNFSTFIEG